jgi:outer membrane protein OmpA-like peptidoglycan-associated protein
MRPRTILPVMLVTAALAGLAAAPGPAAAAELLSAEQIAYQLSQSKSIAGQAKVDLPSVTFEYNSARLTAEARRQLDELAKALNFTAFKGLPFTVAGHTDARGGEAYNQGLSEQRAQAVRDYLTGARGFAPAQVDAVGYGKSRLLPGLPPDAADQRRVEISLRPAG